ncbi:MAG: class I SAM-dependent methyltransferase [Bacteroidota bacterium]
MLKLNTCPACSSGKFKEELICKDHTVSSENFTLVICQDCGFKFTNPRPADDVIGDYYKSENYISHTNTKKGLVSKLYHLVRNYTLKKKIDLIDQYVSRGTILDYGCGTGMFLDACSGAGWKAYGIEPDKGARDIASTRSKVYADKTLIELNHPGAPFDAITLWHVLEHVTDLKETLAFLKLKLKPAGVLIVAVPNHKSYDAGYYKEFWAAYDVPRHLYHFHESTIKQLMTGAGFDLIAAHPMKFDSFYVSMLSEKYKHGSVRYISAFFTGLRSNLKAVSSQEYSSRIYVFKHK